MLEISKGSWTFEILRLCPCEDQLCSNKKQSQQTMSKTCQTGKGRLQTHSVHQICSPFVVPNACSKFVARMVLSVFCFKVVGWADRLGRTTTVSDVHPRLILCARKTRFSEHNHVLSKISGHENGWLVVMPNNVLLFQGKQQKWVVTLLGGPIGRLFGRLSGHFFWRLCGTLFGQPRHRHRHTILILGCVAHFKFAWCRFCSDLSCLLLLEICLQANIIHVIFRSNTMI